MMDKKEILKALSDDYENTNTGLDMIIGAFSIGAPFKFLLDKIDIIEKRMDHLESKFLSLNDSGFSIGQLLAAFLAPAIGNLIVDPLLQGFLDKVFRKGLSSNIIINIEATQKYSRKRANVLTNKITNSIKEKVDLTGAGNSVDVVDLVIGFFNDSSQNAVSIITSYNNSQNAISSKDEYSQQLAKSTIIATFLTQTYVSLQGIQRRYNDLYIATTGSISLSEIDESVQAIYQLYLTAKKNTKIENIQASDQKSIIIKLVEATNKFIWLIYLDMDIGSMASIEERKPYSYHEKDPVGDDRFIGTIYKWEEFQRKNISKEMVDYLITTFPEEEASYLSIILQNAIDRHKISGSLNDLQKKCITDPTFGRNKEIVVSRRSEADTHSGPSDLSYYDQAVSNLLDWLKTARPALNATTDLLVNNLITLSQSKPSQYAPGTLGSVLQDIE